MDKFIIIQNKRYVHYDDFDNFNEARMIGKYHKNLDGNKYFILTIEKGGLNPRNVYRLYLTRILGRIL